MSNSMENDPTVILKNLKMKLTDVNNKIEQSLKSKKFDENEIDIAIDYLNTAIRHLDHATENLLESKNNFSV